MRLFINFFLIAFTLDGLASTVDSFSYLLFEQHPLEPVQKAFAFITLFLSLAVYAALGIDSRLPKRLLLPLILFVVWGTLGCLPLSIYFAIPALTACISLVQLGLAAGAFAFVNTTTGRWLPPPEFFARPVFRPGNTALFVLGSILLIPAAAALLLASSAYAYLDHKTAGFSRLGIGGVHLRERSYTREEKTIRLVAMVHIGSPGYYREIGELLSRGNTLVLLEGITDTQGLMKSPLSYSKIANLIGLDSQEHMAIDGRLLEYADLATLDDGAGAAGPAMVRADIDSREFSEDTRRYIQTVGTLLNSKGPNAGGSRLEGFNEYLKWYGENITPEKEKAIFLEIIELRNETLLRYLDQALPAYDNIVIPWGAMHMPGLERAILQRGFVAAESRTRLAMDFGSLFGKPVANRPADATAAGAD